MIQLVLSKYHRYYIPSFKNYQLSEKDSERAFKLKARAFKDYTSEILIENFKPEERLIDNIIYHNITGYKLDDGDVNHYSDTSEEDQFVRYMSEYTNEGMKRDNTVVKQLTRMKTRVVDDEQTSTALLDGDTENRPDKKPKQANLFTHSKS